MEAELIRLWNLVSEITEQLNQNRLLTEKLQGHAGQLHEQAGQSLDGATLRRFNTDLSKEILTSELERLSVALVMENQSLLHENKQLSTLLQDYEKTLQTVMEKFRGHCHAAQTHQLTLNRHYEALLARERTEDGIIAHATDAEHFANLTKRITNALNCMEGKETFTGEAQEGEILDREEPREERDIDGVGDWAEEREAEIQRLECENAQLRQMLGISPAQERELGLEDVDASLVSSPLWDRQSFARPSSGPSSFRESVPRETGRVTLGLVAGAVEQRRVGLFGRGGFGPDVEPGVSSPERALSPVTEPI